MFLTGVTSEDSVVVS